MEIITYRGRLIELTLTGDPISDQLVLECWDLSPGGGLWFILRRDDQGVIVLHMQRPAIPLDLLERVAMLAGSELP